MTDLVEQHEFITLLHKQLMSHATKQLKFNLTQTTLAADHCDLYIDHTDGEEQTAAEESVVGDVAVVVKNENSPDSMSSADNLELVHEDDNQRDNSNSDCASDDEYSDMIIQLKSELLDEATTETAVAPLSARLAANNNTKVQATEEAGVTQKSEQILETNYGGLDNKSSQSGTKIYTDINRYTNCVVQLYDIFKMPKKVVLHENPHVKTHIDAKPYCCETCDYKCTHKNYLLIHKRIHTGEKPYSCEICNYKAAQKHNLVDHLRTHAWEKLYSCEICNYKCAAKSDLLRHTRCHTGEKPHSCEICNFKCAFKSSLLRHIRNHSGEKPYSCDICSYKCTFKSNLLIHKRKHTGEKPYSCEICNYKTARKHHLGEHLRTHSGEKPYCCEICNYKSAKKNHLVNHLRTHTGEKPYCCEICNYKAAVKHQLVRHLRTHTGEKP